mgnify:FL=1
MKSNSEKKALALVLGIPYQSGIISGIPGAVPGLARTLGCATCELKIVRGLPVQFADYMTDEQKKEFKRLTRRKGAK